MNETTAEAFTRIDASPDKVWHVLTDASAWPKFFMGVHLETDWKVGSPVRMTGEFEGKKFEDKGEILAIEPAKLISFSHFSGMSGQPDVPENYHVVTFKLSPSGGGTEVALTQSNLKGGITDADRKHRTEYEKNWQMVLQGLADATGKFAHRKSA